MKTVIKGAKRDEAIKLLQEWTGMVRLYPASAKLDLSIEVKRKA